MTTKDTLLANAVQLFAAKGIHKTSIRDIAQASGVNLQLVYYYFGSKADLIRETITQASKETTAILDKAEGTDTSIESIRIIVAEFMKASESRNNANKLIGQILMTQDEQALVQVHEAISNNAMRLQKLIKKGIAAGEIRGDINVELAATAIIGLPMWYVMSMPVSTRVGVQYSMLDKYIADILLTGMSTLSEKQV